MNLKTLVLLLASVVALEALPETFLWKNQTSTSWFDYGTPANWRIGTTKDSPVSQDLVPGAGDYLCLYDGDSSATYTTHWYMDLGNVDRTVLGLANGNAEWGPVNIHLRNGSLTVTENFTNTQACVYLEDTGKLTIAATSTSRFGYQGMSDKWYVNAGGELSILGSVTLDTCHMYNYTNSTFTLAPTAFKASPTFTVDNGKGASLSNWGTLNLPNGLDFGGTGSTGLGYFRLCQLDGALNLGGPLTASATKSRFAFVLAGGTVNVQDDASFVTTYANYPFEASMTNGATATVSVAADKTFDASGMAFEADTALVKSGPGTLKLSAVPTELSVEEGIITFGENVVLGDSLSLSPGATLCISAENLSARSIDGITEATVTADPELTSGGACLIFASEDPQLVQTVAARLQASGVTGLTVTDSGIFYEVAHASTVFAWANEGRVNYADFRAGTYTWYPFCAASSWKIGVGRAANADGLIPNENDDFFISDEYQPLFAMDMGGQHRKLRHLHRNFTTGITYKNQAGFRQFNVRNGTLEFTGSFTNVRASVDAKATGRFILSSTSSARLGNDGAEDRFFAEDGGEIDIYGAIKIHRANFTVDAGGKMVFDPVSLAFDTDTANSNCIDAFDNSGTLELPSGLNLAARAWLGIVGCTFTFSQNAGTLKLGGSVVRQTAYRTQSLFYLNGGTIQTMNDAAISGFDVCEMPANATATVDVGLGQTLDLSEMTFGAGTTLTKTGEGTLVLGAGVPTAMLVNGGRIAFSKPVDLGSSLVLARGTVLALGGAVVTASEIAGLADAQVFMDPSLGDSSCAVFASADPELLAAVLAKLASSSASMEGNFGISGNVIVYEKPHDSTVFSWKHEGTGRSNSGTELCETNIYGQALFTWYPFCSAGSWAVGRSPSGTNPDGLIPSADDDMYVSAQYYPIFGMDLGGTSRQLRNLDLNLDADGRYPQQAGFRGFFLRNGELEFTGSFTNVRVVVKAKTDAKFVLGETSFARIGYNGAQNIMYADDGGEIDLLGSMDIHFIQFTVAEGGKGVLAPKSFKMCPNNNQTSYFRNYGTLSLPKGLTFLSGGWVGITTVLNFEHKAGTLEIGGPVNREANFHVPVNFTIEGGTLNVTNQVSFSGLASLTMPDNATVTVNVPKGSSVNFSGMTFGENTTIEKYGTGRLRFGDSQPTNYIRHDPMPGLILIVR